MFITTLEVHNFKSIPEISIHFVKGLNVITGDNGSGKTNLLHAIKFALNENTIPNKDLVYFGKENATVELSFSYEHFETDKYTIYKEINKNDSIKNRKYTQVSNRQLSDYEKSNHFLLLDYDSHCHLNCEELKKYAHYLKEESKNTQIIIVSNSQEIILNADLLVRLENKENKENKGMVVRKLITHR